MNKLPLELLHDIVDDFSSDKKSLLRLRTVNKVICQAASPKAFRTLKFSCNSKGAAAVEGLGKSEATVELIKEIHCSLGEFGGEGDQNSGFDRHPHAKVFSRLPHTFPSLTAIVLTFHDRIPTELKLFKEYTIGLIDILGAVVCDAHLTKLTSLTVSNLIALPKHFFVCEMFAQSLSALESLTLEFVYDEDFEEAFAYGGDVNVFRPDAYPASLAELIPWNLTHLGVLSMQELDYMTRMDLSTLYFPRLSSLFLENITFRPPSFGPPSIDSITKTSNEPGPEEEFIIRHSTSLRTLEMILCLSSYSTYRTPDGRRDWSTIWDRFSRELVHLVDFFVEMADQTVLHVDSYTNLGYGDILEESGMYFLQDLENLAVEKKDTVALERLLHLVDERKRLAA